MNNDENFVKGLEWQLGVEEEGIKVLEKKGAPEELITEARTIRNHTANLVNSLKGPLVGKRPKQSCCFVKLRGGWLIGDE